jgi:hypothetical protein
MRKLLVLLSAIALVVVFTVPATAFESQFGGYWRTRAFSHTNFSGDDTEAMDRTEIDTRTRLYYTAKFTDNLKFVNKFEWNSTWGDTVGGDIGTDGMGIFRIKNSYADFNLGPLNFKMGAHAAWLGRGFWYDDDHMGLTASYKTDAMTTTFYWIKVSEGGSGPDANDADVDYYVVAPSFKVGIGAVKPWLAYGVSKATDLAAYSIGVDADLKFGAVALWLSGIMQGGDQATDISREGTLAAVGVNVPLGAVSVHGSINYGSGDDPATADTNEGFVALSPYWVHAEILGPGITDNAASNNSPFTSAANTMAINVGVSLSPMDKLKLSIDVWDVTLNEEVGGEDKLGTEVDVKATYKLVDNMNLDVVYAYLSAGDATGDTNPTEIAARFSISF